MDVYKSNNGQSWRAPRQQQGQRYQPSNNHSSPLYQAMNDIDYVPCNLPRSLGNGRLIIFEDNDAVIKQCIKGRSPVLRHVARTRRVDLDWLWERIRLDPGIFINDVGTKEQIADTFTKGSFTSETWTRLCRLAQIGEVKSLSSTLK